MMNIQVSIERLILHGIEVADDERLLLQTAVQAELTRLLMAHGPAANLQAGGTYPAIHTDAIQVTGDNPTHLGRQIAQAVYGGISQ
jgi:hypothetical protein